MIKKLKEIGLATIVRCAVLIILLINLILVQLGVQEHLFDFNDTYTMVYEAISTMIVILSALWAAWKDNDITKKAISRKEDINNG